MARVAVILYMAYIAVIV